VIYGKSTVFFFAPSITSILGRGGAGSFATFADAESRTAGLAVVNRLVECEETGAGLAGSLEPASGAITARSPLSSVVLFAP